MRGKLYKSNRDKMILGVCGGLGSYLEIDSSLIRVLWVIASLVYGTGILLYFILGIILPEEDERKEEPLNNQQEDKSAAQKENSKIIGIILICLGIFFMLQKFIRIFDFQYIFPVGLIALGIFLMTRRKEKDNEE